MTITHLAVLNSNILYIFPNLDTIYYSVQRYIADIDYCLNLYTSSFKLRRYPPCDENAAWMKADFYRDNTFQIICSMKISLHFVETTLTFAILATQAG